jgi:hypothetical protein
VCARYNDRIVIGVHECASKVDDNVRARQRYVSHDAAGVQCGRSVRLQCSIVASGGAVGDRGGDDHHFLERAKYLVDARVRAGNEPERAQHQRGAVHHQFPAEQAVTIVAIISAGDRHMA